MISLLVSNKTFSDSLKLCLSTIFKILRKSDFLEVSTQTVRLKSDESFTIKTLITYNSLSKLAKKMT